jgi:hypothetical protein
MDVAKLDRNVAYVVMVVHISCKFLFSMFLFLDVCCKCVYLDVAYIFTHMLQVFYLDVACVLQWFQVFFRCFCKCFRRMF